MLSNLESYKRFKAFNTWVFFKEHNDLSLYLHRFVYKMIASEIKRKKIYLYQEYMQKYCQIIKVVVIIEKYFLGNPIFDFFEYFRFT